MGERSSCLFISFATAVPPWQERLGSSFCAGIEFAIGKFELLPPRRDRLLRDSLAAGFESRIECHAAVHEDTGAVDVIGIIRGKPHHGTADVVRLADAFVG